MAETTREVRVQMMRSNLERTSKYEEELIEFLYNEETLEYYKRFATKRFFKAYLESELKFKVTMGEPKSLDYYPEEVVNWVISNSKVADLNKQGILPKIQAYNMLNSFNQHMINYGLLPDEAMANLIGEPRYKSIEISMGKLQQKELYNLN